MMSEALLALSYYVIMLCKETLALELPKVENSKNHKSSSDTKLHEIM